MGIIYVEADAVEAEEFVTWLNNNGYESEISTIGSHTESEEVNQLWTKYCSGLL